MGMRRPVGGLVEELHALKTEGEVLRSENEVLREGNAQLRLAIVPVMLANSLSVSMTHIGSTAGEA